MQKASNHNCNWSGPRRQHRATVIPTIPLFPRCQKLHGCEASSLCWNLLPPLLPGSGLTPPFVSRLPVGHLQKEVFRSYSYIPQDNEKVPKYMQTSSHSYCWCETADHEGQPRAYFSEKRGEKAGVPALGLCGTQLGALIVSSVHISCVEALPGLPVWLGPVSGHATGPTHPLLDSWGDPNSLLC